MRDAVQKLEDVVLDLTDIHSDMIRLQENGFAGRVSELKDEIYNLIIDLEDESLPSSQR